VWFIIIIFIGITNCNNKYNNNNLEKCATICLKRGSVQSKMQVGSLFENDINPCFFENLIQ
jgi:hypothetical protein